ncbi:hypothetical protein Tco_0857713 [Tanacetum coccineum]|uniref:Uncharacterized protein n=1 Tax=Tanacetum coccineum TaxID=301880 RepID=A0ABQ5B701_9ASTR
MSLVNQDLFYLKYGNSGKRKHIPSPHKIHVVPFPKNDLEELNTRWITSEGNRRKEITLMKSTLMANGEYSEFSESDYKYLYKNDIEDMYLMCINRKIKDYRQTGLLSKKEKRVMDIKEIPKFYDATLKRVLEKVKKFNLDVKHGYADPKLKNEDVEYMRFYEEYIIDHLRHRDQVRRWKSYVIGRPLEQRNERPE